MNRIRRLPDDVSNQIAAGEVVERPASVVKELFENSLDAGASRVEVQVEDGGRRLIRVVDDGSGMGPDDALACLDRHATSKIASAADLDAVHTLGFRGEAIPSIASVSRFCLTTREAGAPHAVRVRVDGGAVGAREEVGAPVGTEVQVEDLFYNVPARLKFMKRAATEMGHIAEAVTRLALAWPRVGVRLVSSGRTVVEAPPEVASDPRGRVARLLGQGAADRLLTLQPDDRPHDIEVEGFVSEPGWSERTSRSHYVFLHGRFIRDRGVHHAIQEAYRPFLERGRHPVVVLHLSLPPGSFDVNVHPQKTEVRFTDPRAVHRALVGAIARNLERAGVGPARRDAVRRVAARPTERERAAAFEAQAPWGASLALDAPVARPMFPARQDPQPPQPSEKSPQRVLLRDPPHAVGLVRGRFLVAEVDDRVLLVDAREVQRKQAMLAVLDDGAASAQRVLVPLVVELGPSATALEDRGALLEELGFELEAFGGGAFSVAALPAGLAPGDAEASLRALAELDEVSAESAARAVVRAARTEPPRAVEAQRALLDALVADPRLEVGVDGRATCVALDDATLGELVRHG